MPKSDLKSKSPAEFFAEHQNIAGFDNPGKSLYTTVREFVENSLDAAEAIQVLPTIELSIEQIDQSTLDDLRGFKSGRRKDMRLYAKSKRGNGAGLGDSEDTGAAGASEEKGKGGGRGGGRGGGGKGVSSGGGKRGKRIRRSASEGNVGYFRVTCRDNGGGMPHAKIPRMLGVVLSSTKYGVKQTRGKFGLGAKMALVWAKKSTGMPVKVESAQEGQRITVCKLDIDIHKNEPRVLLHDRRPNPKGWRGTSISVVISGNWTNYRSKVINYLRQLAVITPYAQIHFCFKSADDGNRRGVELQFKRRSEQCPAPPTQVRHHPSSVDNLVIESLVATVRPGMQLRKFLSTQLSSITPTLASRLIQELGSRFEPEMPVGEMTKKQIHQVTSLLRDARFPKPSGACLSPAGEYNMRLGILKELNPETVATFSEPVAVHEGHPFIVEAAVSLGGSIAKPGVNVFRYANRIPLLFEAGSDITTQIATKKIRWGSYKIKNTDKVGVFVSIVSTKIPFKGTSKEYIGDDNGPIHASIRHAISQCCIQLRKELVKRNALRTQADRKKALVKYIPDVCRALMQTLGSMTQEEGGVAFGPRARASAAAKSVELKRLGDAVVERHASGKITEKEMRERLRTYVERVDAQLALDFATKRGRDSKNKDVLYAVPLDKKRKTTGPLPHDDFQFSLLL